MKSVTKLKDEARKHEQREEWDRAIQLYLQVLRASDEEALGESELPLYNRVGDLHVRMGQPADAVTYYEQAADRYAEAGLFNNAIALCNKALRYQPARLSLFRKLGQYCAQQGFLTDARRWYLEYAERMLKHGELDEAFNALDDFANVSDDPEVRVHLARKLQAHDRGAEALDEFRRAYATWLRSGETAAADGVRAEVLELYPGGPDLAEEETAAAGADHPGGGSGLGLPELGEPDLPTIADRAEAPGPAAAVGAPEDEAPAEESDAAPLAGFEGTQLAGSDTTGDDVGASTLAGLDTGRDDTLERLQRESPVADEAEPETEGLPLLHEADVADEPVAESEDEEESDLGLPLLGGAGEDMDSPAEIAAETTGSGPDVGSLDVRPEQPAQQSSTATAASDDYVDLYALLAPEEDKVETTRFFIQESEPTGDEDHDFAELLNQFRRKLAEHVPENDAGSHYDLGLAFKEMGLVDDAISEFQIALRAGQDRLKVFEELGQCFILKEQHNIAVKVLSRALQFQHRDEMELIGVYYFLGRAYEELGQAPSARDAYERVMGLDIRFEDVQERIARL